MRTPRSPLARRPAPGWWLTPALAALAVLSALLLSLPAQAQAPASSLRLGFTQPAGVVGPTDSIPVELRFSNLDATLPFAVDPALPLFGLAAEFVPAEGSYYDPKLNEFVTLPFASYSMFSLTVGFGCSGSFTTSCTSGPPYTFTFADNPFPPPGTAFVLAPGASMTYLFGSFAPTDGNPVAPGTYEFYRSVVWMNVSGLSDTGIELGAVVFPASTCPFDSAADCSANGHSFFTRTVEVPEPASALLWAAGLAALGGTARRRLRRPSAPGNRG